MKRVKDLINELELLNHIVGEGSLTISDKCLQLYGLLTGSEPFNVEKQLSLLKTIDSNLRELPIIAIDLYLLSICLILLIIFSYLIFTKLLCFT